jgi:hypothetical protein
MSKKSSKSKAKTKTKPRKRAKEPKVRKRKPKARTKAKVKTSPKAKTRTEFKAKPSKAKPSKAKPSKAKPSKAKVKAKPFTKTVRPSKTKTKIRAKAKAKEQVKAQVKPKRRKRAVKRVFEKRPRRLSPEVLEPEVGATTQDEAFATIKARLEDAQKLLPDGLESTVRVHPYVDGSVDGELRINVPRELRTGETSWELMDSFGAITLGQRYWVSVGANYIIEADEQIYRRFRGMNQVQTNYQRAVKSNITEEGLILRRTIIPGMKKRHKREAHSVFIRLHWNPGNEHPKR